MTVTATMGHGAFAAGALQVRPPSGSLYVEANSDILQIIYDYSGH